METESNLWCVGNSVALWKEYRIGVTWFGVEISALSLTKYVILGNLPHFFQFQIHYLKLVIIHR
jgi:hypothetical protein